jgi:hypothetical protein
MIDEPISGYLPPGEYEPTASTGTCRCLPEDHARQRLHLEVGQRGALRSSETLDLRERVVDVGAQRRVDPVGHGGALVLADAERLGRPAVEPLGPVAHGCHAVALHREQDLRDGVAHLLAGRLRPGLRALQVLGHETPHWAV